MKNERGIGAVLILVFVGIAVGIVWLVHHVG